MDCLNDDIDFKIFNIYTSSLNLGEESLEKDVGWRL